MSDPRQASAGRSPPRIGFACSWWRPREPTWSFTPKRLRQGMQRVGADLLDIDAQPPLILQAPLAAGLTAFGRRPWKYADTYQRVQEKRVLRAARQGAAHVLVCMADLMVKAEVPSYVYQDMGFSVALDYMDVVGADKVSTFVTCREVLKRVADRQQVAYSRLDGTLVMGQWFADYLVSKGLVSAARVHVIGAGVGADYQNLPRRTVASRPDRRRILFVGQEFLRKGGDHLLAAIAALNRSGDRPLRLTVVGPARWPLQTEPPAWVDFLGSVPEAELPALYQKHDVLVMPSRFEAYGKVFLEARAAGIPCVGRDAFAMPELICPGVAGALWRNDDIIDLASTIQSVLDDEGLHEQTMRHAPTVARENSWESVGKRILDVLSIAA